MVGPSRPKRLGFIVVQDSGLFDISVGPELSSAAQAEIDVELSVAVELKPLVTAFNSAHRAHDEFHAALIELVAKLDRAGTATIAAVHENLDSMDLLALRLSSFLSSASAFLTQTERTLGALYGPASTTLMSFNDCRRAEHKDRFAYRFLYELRNYSQHYAVPLSRMNFRGAGDDPKGFKFAAHLWLDREKLLATSFNWKKLRGELMLQEESFDVIPMVGDYWMSLRKATAAVLNDQRLRIANALHYLQHLRAVSEVPAGGTLVVWLGDYDGSGPPSKMEVVPAAELMRLLQVGDICADVSPDPASAS